MQTVAKFEKVSEKQYAVQDAITLPKRATKGSAGYDFYIPNDHPDITLKHNEFISIPTGVRCKIKEDWVLMLYPRSGLGFKGLRLYNTCGVIDSDYYYADNEGHIMAKIVNSGFETITLHGGDRFMQGVFLPYGIVEDDDAKEKRSGGFGSTGTN